MRIENVIEIERSACDTFDFLADLEHIPLWNYYVRSVRRISGSESLVGTVFRQVRRRDEQDLRIEHADRCHEIRVSTVSETSLGLQVRWILEPTGRGTRLRDLRVIDLHRGRLADWLFAGRVRRAVAANLRKLKSLLETGRVTLQDGRVISID